MRTYLGAVVAAAAAAMVTAIPAFAASNTVLSDGAVNPGGTNTVAGGMNAAVITSGLKSGGKGATFFTTSTGTTGFTCTTSTTSATVETNPIAPGTATLFLTDLKFANCTPTNINGFKTVGITTDNRTYSVEIASNGFTVTIMPGVNGPIHITATVTDLFGLSFTCGYHAHMNLQGSASNKDNSIAFSNQQFDIDTNPSQNSECVQPNVFFSATYAPLVDSNHNSAAVFIN